MGAGGKLTGMLWDIKKSVMVFLLLTVNSVRPDPKTGQVSRQRYVYIRKITVSAKVEGLN